MSYGKAQLEELALKLSKIGDTLTYELPEFWWLSQGEEAVVIVRILKKNKKIEVFETPKMTLKAAIRTVINNIDIAKKLKGKEFYHAIKIIEEDIASIVNIYSMIKEAHSIVKRAENLKKYISKSNLNPNKIQEYKQMLSEVIKWIREIFTTNPRDWKNRKDFFERVVNKIEAEVSQQIG